MTLEERVAALEIAVQELQRMHDYREVRLEINGQDLVKSIKIDPKDFQRATYDKSEDTVESFPPYREEATYKGFPELEKDSHHQDFATGSG